MTFFAFDLETELFRPAAMAPPVVCVSYQRQGETPGLLHHAEALTHVRRWLESDDTLVGANVAYDAACLGAEWPELVPLIFDKYGGPGEPSGIRCVKVRQQLLDIATGQFRGRVVGKTRGAGLFLANTYDLNALLRRHTGRTLTKDTWRLHYGRFRNVPFAEWPAVAAQVRAEMLAQIDAEFAALNLDNKSGREAGEKLQATRASWLAEPLDGAMQYPLEDARAALDVALAQEPHAKFFQGEHLQTRAAFWLHLVATWGLRTDRRRVEKLRASAEAYRAELQARLGALDVRALYLEHGFPEPQVSVDRKGDGAAPVRKDGTRCVAAAEAIMRLAYDLRVRNEFTALLEAGAAEGDAWTRANKSVIRRVTKTGIERVKGGADPNDWLALDADACEQAGLELVDPKTGDVWHPLMSYAEYTTFGKVLSNDVEALVKGVEYPIHTSFGMAATTRTTSSKPNVQNPRRLEGIREIYEPRPGYVYFDSDYNQVEMCTLAQVCVQLFGSSPLADAINAGEDPHLVLAADILEITQQEAKRRRKAQKVGIEDKALDAARQTAKVGNFGVPGGLGAEKLCLFAWKTYRVKLSLERAKWLIALTKKRWGLARYFQYINGLCEAGEDGLATFLHPVNPTPGVWHMQGGALYTAACNAHFQHLAACIAKDAGFEILRRQYAEPTSRLFGSRTVNFVHDQFIGECLDDFRAHDVAHELSEVMIAAGKRWCPDVAITTEPTLMRVWSKAAFPLKDDSGRLRPWNGERVDEITKQLLLPRRDAEGYVIYEREKKEAA